MENQPKDVKSAVELALAEHFKSIDPVLSKHTDDLKTFGSVQESTKAAIADLNTKGQELIIQFREQKERQDALMLEMQQKLAGRQGGADSREKSIGERFIESEELKAFALIAKSGTGKFQSRPFRTKNITSVSASGGAGIAPQYVPTPVIPNFQNLRIRDLLSVGTTESDLIYWFQENVFTNNAGVVSEGSLKPQSDITYVRKNVSVSTIAHWMKASKQVLADFKMLMTLINTRLTFGLKLAEEQEILYGDGVGDHLLGLVPQATVYNQGTVSGDTEIDIIAKAMLQVRLAFYPADGIVMSPSDWWKIMLTKDSQHRYLFQSPVGNLGPAMLWGLPVVISDSFHAGDFLVGSMKLGATLFDREESQILVSTEDQDNFVRNMVTILCEERLALAVTRPASFVYGNFPAGTST